MAKADPIRRYMLEIYEPGSTRDVMVLFESETPFLPINEGDIINSRVWPHPEYTGKVYRATGPAEHIIWTNEAGETRHKVLIFTEEVEDDEEARLTR